MLVVHFEDVNDMRFMHPGSTVPIAATILGYDFPADENWSVYWWDYYNEEADNGTSIVKPTTNPEDPGRWVQIDINTLPQVNADWEAVAGPASILNKPTLSDVALSNSYLDLDDKPTIPDGQVNSDWNASSGVSQVLNKPPIPAAQVNSNWTAVSGLSQILNKPTFSTVASTGAYSDLTGKPSLAAVATSGLYSDLTGKPSIQTIQRTRAQTNTSGVYTWTFPTAFAATPIISVTVEDNTSASWNHQITAISATSVTIQLVKTTAVTLLGISVLGIGATPQAYVHLTAVAA